MTSPITSFQDKYRFLSNFWPVEVRIGDLEFGSVEAAYQASKCEDIGQRAQFTTLGPGEAKKLGRRIRVRPDWDAVKLQVMESLLEQKFEAWQEELVEQLLNTGDAELVEGNTWGDAFWGVCGGKGENHLGKLLMKIREQIKLDSQADGGGE